MKIAILAKTPTADASRPAAFVGVFPSEGTEP